MDLQVGCTSAGRGRSPGSGLWALASRCCLYHSLLRLWLHRTCDLPHRTHSGSEAEGTTMNWTCSSHSAAWEHKRASQTLQVHFKSHVLIPHWPKQVTWPTLKSRGSKVLATHHEVLARIRWCLSIKRE